MQPQVNLINRNLSGLIKACQDNVEFRLPAVTWTRFLNEGIMDMYDLLFIEAETILQKDDGYFLLPDNFKQLYMLGTPQGEYREGDIGSSRGTSYQFYNADATGVFNIFDGKLTVNDYEGDTILLRYYRKPKFLELINKDSQEIDVPNEFIEPIILYACAKAMQAEDETERYSVFLNSYQMKRKNLEPYVHRNRPERKLYWSIRR